MEPHSTSKPATVPIVAACREVSTTVSVRRASREPTMSTSLQRRRQAKGWRSASASRRPGFARASCSVSRSSTSTGGKGACLNGAAAAAAALYTAHASIELPSGREGADERQVENSNLRSARACPNQYFPALLRPRAPCSRASQVSTLHSPSTSAARACCELGAAAGRGGGAHACCPALRGGAAVSVRAAPQGRRGQGRGRVARRAYGESRLGAALGGGLGGGRRRAARKRATWGRTHALTRAGRRAALAKGVGIYPPPLARALARRRRRRRRGRRRWCRRPVCRRRLRRGCHRAVRLRVKMRVMARDEGWG